MGNVVAQPYNNCVHARQKGTFANDAGHYSAKNKGRKLMARNIRMLQKSKVEPCPKCGNNLLFNILSEQVAEDSCDVWAECAVCGYDPTSGKEGHRLESVWGGTDDNNCIWAVECWNEEIREDAKTIPQENSTQAE